MIEVKTLLATMLLLNSLTLHAETPCDFKGLSVGDRVTQQQAMAALGIKKFKIDPKRISFDERLKNSEKFSMVPALEMEEWDIGPFCVSDACRIPSGVDVGYQIPVSVYIAFDKNLITEIDVAFGRSDWESVASMLRQKYGKSWKVDTNSIYVLDYPTKESSLLERISWMHPSGGVNPKTKDGCQIWANNLDLIFTHQDPLGQYHGNFIIKLISKNF